MPRSINKTALACAAGAVLVSGCVAGPAPENLGSSVYAPGQMAWAGSEQPQGDWISDAPVARGAPTCSWDVPRELDTYRRVSPAAFLDRTAPLGTGDRLEITVLGDEDRLTGTYVIESDGTIALRGQMPVQASGLSIQDLTTSLHTQLVNANLVRPLQNAVRVSLIENAGTSVAVSGAVFQPGAVRAGERLKRVR